MTPPAQVLARSVRKVFRSAEAATPTYAVDPEVVRRLAQQVVCAPDAETFAIITPMTGSAIAHLPLSTVADVERAMDSARAAQEAWALVPFATKKAILRRFHDLVLAHQYHLLDLLQLKSGKARGHAF